MDASSCCKKNIPHHVKKVRKEDLRRKVKTRGLESHEVRRDSRDTAAYCGMSASNGDGLGARFALEGEGKW